MFTCVYVADTQANSILYCSFHLTSLQRMQPPYCVLSDQQPDVVVL